MNDARCCLRSKFSANDQVVQREIRAAVDRLTHIDDEATTFAERSRASTPTSCSWQMELERHDKQSKQ